MVESVVAVAVEVPRVRERVVVLVRRRDRELHGQRGEAGGRRRASPSVMSGGVVLSVGGQPVESPLTEKYSKVTVSPDCSTPCVYRPNFGATIALVTVPENAVHAPASVNLYSPV